MRLVVLSATLHDQISNSQERRMVGQLAAIKQVHSRSRSKLSKGEPRWVAPMLATLTDEPFSRRGWLFEPKLDGVRCLALRSSRDVQLVSRNEKAMNEKYPELAQAFRAQKANSF